MSASLPDWLDPSPWLGLVQHAGRALVRQAAGAESPGIREFAALLSPAAAGEIETLAQRAQALTRRHFGRTISLYAPLYVSNYCPSGCSYCGFASDRRIRRHKMTPAELATEAGALKKMGLEEILLLTGDRVATADYGYVRDSVSYLASRFHNVCAEIFAMSEEEYSGLAAAGCTSVTMYQETYDRLRYEPLHGWGPKRDYGMAARRACQGA